MIDDYSGLQKAAILLITLGPEKASAIFQHLKEDEIESLTLEIANTRSVSPQDKESVLDEYYQVCLAQQYIAEGGIGYAKELLEKALGSEKAQGVISKLTASLQGRPFELLLFRCKLVLKTLYLKLLHLNREGKTRHIICKELISGLYLLILCDINLCHLLSIL